MAVIGGRSLHSGAFALGMLGLALSDLAMFSLAAGSLSGVMETVLLVAGMFGGFVGYFGWFAWQTTTIRRRASAVGEGVLFDGVVFGLAAGGAFAVLVVLPQLGDTVRQAGQIWLLGCLVADAVLVWLAVPVMLTKPSRRAALVSLGLIAHVGFDLTHASVFGELTVSTLRFGEFLAAVAFVCWFASLKVSDATPLAKRAVARTAQFRSAGLVAALVIPTLLLTSLLWGSRPTLTLTVAALSLTLAALVVMRIRQLVSAMATMQAEMVHQAEHDHLTSVWNRRALIDYIGQMEDGDGLRAVLYLDLDGFKAVNDRYGHDAGDHVLVTVAERLSAAIRGSDRVARIGGDEFVVVVTDIDTDIERFVGRLTAVLNDEPIIFEGRPLDVGASIGVAHSVAAPDGDSERRSSLSHTELYRELLSEADAAMFKAKAARKHRAARPDSREPESIVV